MDREGDTIVRTFDVDAQPLQILEDVMSDAVGVRPARSVRQTAYQNLALCGGGKMKKRGGIGGLGRRKEAGDHLRIFSLYCLKGVLSHRQRSGRRGRKACIP
jgi:hypothetical protein